MKETYSAIVIDPDNGLRLQLKRAADESFLFESMSVHEDFASAKLTLVHSECDIVFVSHSFPVSDSSAFISSVKSTMGGKNAVFILVVSNQSEATVISRHLAIGFSGFLVAPYSLAAVSEIVELVKRLRIKFTADAEVGTLSMLAREIFGEIDIVHALTTANIVPHQSKRVLTESCEVLRSLTPAQIQRFYDIAGELLDAPISAPLLPPGYRYTGNSRRVPVQIERELIDALDKKLKGVIS